MSDAVQSLLSNDSPQIQDAAAFRKEMLLPLLEDIKIHSLLQFQIGDRPAVSLDGASATAGPQPLAQRLSNAMWPELYNCAYAVPYGSQRSPNQSGQDIPSFLSQLRTAFPEGTRLSADWEVYKNDANGAVHVRKGDCCRHVQPGAFVVNASGPVQERTVVSILLPLASSQVQPVFYHVNGHTPHSDHDDAALARLYFNTKPSTVISLMSRIAKALNGYAVPFRAKTLADPAGYERTDSTVFYLARRHLPFALALLKDVLEEETADLEPAVPLFAKVLASGIGGADDPGFGMSFGQTRAMLMADVVIDAWSAGTQSAQARLDQLERRFASSSLSLAKPHLSAGNIDIYAFSA